MEDRKMLGILGEYVALEITKANGGEILAKNYSTKLGEIDLIAYKEECIHFIEVKTRMGHEFGQPVEAVNHKKQEKIRQVANCFLRERNLYGLDVSFDVIGIEVNMVESCF